MVRIRECGPAERATGGFRGDRLIRLARQRTAAALASQAAQARAGAFGFLRAVGLLALRRRRAGIVRCFRGIGQSGLKRDDAGG